MSHRLSPSTTVYEITVSPDVLVLRLTFAAGASSAAKSGREASAPTDRMMLGPLAGTDASDPLPPRTQIAPTRIPAKPPSTILLTTGMVTKLLRRKADRAQPAPSLKLTSARATVRIAMAGAR